MAVTRALSVAIVGAGLMGRWHARAGSRAGARVAAIVDPDRSRAARLARKYPGCRPLTVFDGLGHVDVIHVCTPGATHVELTRRAIAAGCHAIVEKPMAPDAAAVEDLLEAAARKGVLLCPVHQFLFQDGVQNSIETLAAIGPVQHVALTMCSAGADGSDDTRREEIALEMLPHPLSLVRLLLPGAPADVDWVVRHPAPGELRALAQMQQVTASVVISLRGRPPVTRMEIIGAQGTKRVDLFHGFAVTAGGRVSRGRKIARPFTDALSLGTAAAANLGRRLWRREPAYPGLRLLIDRFYRAVETGGAPPIPPLDVLWTARACDRIASHLRDQSSGARLAP